MTIRENLLALIMLTGATAIANAQDNIIVTGSIQSDILIPQEDKKIEAEKYNDWALTNTYAEVGVMSKYVDAGGRFEFLKHPLPGYADAKGWGLGNIYARLHVKNFEVTVGNFYEQFGSGFILRTYEERNIGVDNSLLGARVMVKPLAGVTIKALSGKQRHFWSYNDALVSGGDVELSLDEWFKGLSNNGTYLTIGASMVNKHEDSENIPADATHKLNLPLNVNAYDFRIRLQRGGWNVLAEYAGKTQDPSSDNGYIYRDGYVAMLSTSYSKKGLSMLLQAKRSDNMSFRSRRTINAAEQLNSSYINHLPAFTTDHTYALAALYPYNTQPDGEWAYQAELGYNFKRHTPLGGKYGTNVKVNFSHIHAIDKNMKGDRGTDGYGSAFWKWGDETYYQDFNVQVEKKLSSDFKLNLMYMNQFYNKTVIKHEAGEEGGMVHSDIFIAEGKYRFNKKLTLRGEAQYLSTKDDEGDWIYGLLELSVLPNWMFTVADEYNCGKTKIHYYSGYVTFNKGSHRLQVGYARTRGGFDCSGGVCRWVPATKGATLSYNYNF